MVNNKTAIVKPLWYAYLTVSRLVYSAFGTSKAVSAICFDFTICPVCSDKIFRTLRKLTYVHTPTHVNILGTPFSSSTFGTRLAVTVTTTDHTHFHSRPHSNTTSFLQWNKGVGCALDPRSQADTLCLQPLGKHWRTFVGKWLTNCNGQCWTMCSHCVTKLVIEAEDSVWGFRYTTKTQNSPLKLKSMLPFPT